jgi:hypothetical protein
MYITATVRNIIYQLEEIVFFVIYIAIEIVVTLSSFHVQPLIIPLSRQWNNDTRRTYNGVCPGLPSNKTVLNSSGIRGGSFKRAPDVIMIILLLQRLSSYRYWQ